MKKIICVLGMLFGICCTTVGVLLFTENMNFASKSSSYQINKSNTKEIDSYRFGADFYTEVSKELMNLWVQLIIHRFRLLKLS